MTDTLTPIPVRTALLNDLVDPFWCPPWYGMPIFTPDDVRQAAADGLLRAGPVTEWDAAPDVHLARIAIP